MEVVEVNMTPLEFWQSVYIAAIKSGKERKEALYIADAALNDYRDSFPKDYRGF